MWLNLPRMLQSEDRTWWTRFSMYHGMETYFHLASSWLHSTNNFKFETPCDRQKKSCGPVLLQHQISACSLWCQWPLPITSSHLLLFFSQAIWRSASKLSWSPKSTVVHLSMNILFCVQVICCTRCSNVFFRKIFHHFFFSLQKIKSSALRIPSPVVFFRFLLFMTGVDHYSRKWG